MSCELPDVDRALEFAYFVLSRIPDDHPKMPLLLASLAGAHDTRFDIKAERDDIDKAIEYSSIALTLTSDDNPGLPALLLTLGTAHRKRSKWLDEVDDLDKSIEYLSIALSLATEDHPNFRDLVISLGKSHTEQFNRQGKLVDIDRAIEYYSYLHPSESPPDNDPPDESPISLCDKAIGSQSLVLAWSLKKQPEYSRRLESLGMPFSDRLERLAELGDFEEVVKYVSRAVPLVLQYPLDSPSLLVYPEIPRNVTLNHLAFTTFDNDNYPEFSDQLAILGLSHHERFRHSGELDDLEKAVDYKSRGLALATEGHPNLPVQFVNLGISYIHRFHLFNELGDLERAVEYVARSITLSPDDDKDLPGRYYPLTICRFLQYHYLDSGSALEEALEFFRRASHSVNGSPVIRFQYAFEWARLAYKHNSLNCIEAYQTTIGLLPRFVWLGNSAYHRYTHLVKVVNLAVNAASAAISFSAHGLALEWLEHTRCIAWNQSLMFCSPLGFKELQMKHPHLASHLQTVAENLHHGSSASSVSASDELVYNSSTRQRVDHHRHRLAEEYDELLSVIRNIPGFESFLGQIKASDLVRAARNGPIAVINCNTDSCDALLIAPAQDDIRHVPLPNFTWEKARQARTQMEASLRCKGIRERGVKIRQDPGHKDEMPSVLSSLWYDIVKPVLDCLGYTDKVAKGSLPHITWCPTGTLSFLPLHAAGDYDQPESRVFDYVVSSYTPTLTSLLSSAPSTLDSNSRLLAIGLQSTPGHNPLPGTAKELLRAQAHTGKVAGYTQLLDSQATMKAVLNAMEHHDWVHLACHAHQNAGDPSKSGFFLHDGTLDLSTINRRSLKNKGLAFLSACQTAAGDEKLPDEAIHLASCMLMAGYSSVIATMWSVMDNDAPFVADKVYDQLMKDGKIGGGEAGKALHYAVAELREKVGEKEFGRWVPYIHVGS